MESCHGGISLLLKLAVFIVAAAAVAKSSSTSTPTLSWSSELSITIDAGNGSAIVKGSALVSPDHKSWAFGVVVGTNSTEGNIPVAFGIFKAVDTSSPVPTWEWKPLSSSQIASATVSFEPGTELVLLVKWRNSSSSSGSSVAWSSATGGEAQAVALTNTGQLLLLDANNQTIWQRPGQVEAPGPASTSAPLSPCPANICLLPPPPSSSPPAPPRSPSRASRATSPAPLLLLLLLISPLLPLS